MLTLDTEQLERQRREAAREKHRADTDRFIAEQFRDAAYVREDGQSIANIERQLGKSMTGKVFKERLEKLCPDVKVEMHPYKKDKMCIYDCRGDGKGFFMACEADIMPEWSQMGKEKKAKFDGLNRVEEEVPWREEKRGWRTVLAGLVTGGLLDVTKAEKFCVQYGSESRRSWKTLTGQRKGIELF